MGMYRNLTVCGLLAAVTVAMMPTATFAQKTSSINRGPSGLPLPRFVSLKAERVNMRVGPGKQYAVSWRYMKQGLPLEIVQEYDNWRRVRDAEGTLGWIHGSLLSGKRTAIAAPWGKDDDGKSQVTLHQKPMGKSHPIAFLKPGVVGEITECDGVWCLMEVSHDSSTLKGYANQAELWGAYSDETFE